MLSSPITSWQIVGEKVEAVIDFIFLDSKTTADGDCSSKASILRCSAFFIVQLSHPYVTTGKTVALTRRTLVGKVMSLLFNILSRLVIDFLLRSKRLLISCPHFADQKTDSQSKELSPVPQAELSPWPEPPLCPSQL